MSIITENTGLTIGVVAMLGGVIWWAATMQSKLDQLLALATKVEDLERRVSVLEAKK